MPFATRPTDAGGAFSSPGRMAHTQRRMARDRNSSLAAGKTAYSQRKVLRADVDGQMLLPGIPNQVTTGNIASKLDWKTGNVLQMVSRGWRQAIHNRDVYDAKMLSKSTKAFLVVLSYEDHEPNQKLVLTLYSCGDGYFLRLPPIPFIRQMYVFPGWIDCVCLEGRVYLWIRQRRTEPVQLYVLDLAGHQKWERRKPVNHLNCNHGLGVLDGKIYRFRINTSDTLTLNYPFEGRALSIEHKVQKLPHTEMYDPQHDAWSLITPAPPVSAVVSNMDLERHLASFSDWAEKTFAADPSKTFLTNGRYESYFSEWKQNQSREYSTTSTVDNDSDNGMATQVYYSHLHSSTLSNCVLKSEEKLFFRGKLVKYKKNLSKYFAPGAKLDIQEYDAQTNIWEHWKSVSMNFQSLKEDRTFSINNFDGFATANNSLWAIAGVHSMNDGKPIVTYFLVRSPELVGDDNVKFLMWIDTGFQVGSSRFITKGNALRPIYL